MKTINKAVEFNRTYIDAWSSYYKKYAGELEKKLDILIAGLDEESKEICVTQYEVAPFFFNSKLGSVGYLPESAKYVLLTEKTKKRFEQLGVYSDDFQQKIDDLQVKYSLPVAPLPELFVHSGLKYLPSIARKAITGKTVIDAGAYIGDTARVFADHYAPEKVYALEPDNDNFDILRNLVSEWELEKKIVPLNVAVGEKSGTTSLFGTGVGASLMGKTGEQGKYAREIEIVSIDELVVKEKIKEVGFIKYDVEGYELESVKGSLETIIRDQPLLVISIYHNARDFFEIKPFLENLGLEYNFIVRKLTNDFIKEVVLIAVPRRFL